MGTKKYIKNPDPEAKLNPGILLQILLLFY